jgi:hypothetical protein
MQTSKRIKSWITLVAAGVFLIQASACWISPVIPEIPELPVRTLASPVADQNNDIEQLVDIDLENNIYCNGEEAHPIGESISQTYDVEYAEVIRLYCSGFTFDNILLAFATSQQTDLEYSPRELLQMKLTMSWDEIWDDIGIIEND